MFLNMDANRMRMVRRLRRLGSIACVLLSTASAAQTTQPDRSHEGEWYVSDTTDNNTGEREVYAFATTDLRINNELVQLEMRCLDGKPTFYVDWFKLELPSRTAVTIGAVSDPDAEPAEASYVFEKHDDDYHGARASPKISAEIVAAIGSAKYATVTVHLSTGSRSIGLDVDGTQRAWARVSRHCPVRIMPTPPL